MTTDRNLSDAEAIALTLSGQRDAFEVLVERYLPIIKPLLLAQLGVAEIPADIVQDVFLKAYRALPSCRPPEKFGWWLIAIARNTAQNLPPKQPSQTKTVDGRAPSDTVHTRGPEPEDARAAILRRVAALPELLREVVVLHFVAGTSSRDLAAFLGISKWAAARRLLQARRTLGERELNQVAAAFKHFRTRKEDVLAVMVVIRSVLAPPTGYVVSPVPMAPSRAQVSTLWLAAGVAVLALLGLLVWNTRLQHEEESREGSATPTSARPASPVSQEPKAGPETARNSRVPAARKPTTGPESVAPMTPAKAPSPSDTTGGPDRANLLFAILPQRTTIRDSEDLFRDDPSGKFAVLVSCWAGRVPPADYQLEIRNGDGAVLRGKVLYRPRFTQRGASGLSAEDPVVFSDTQVRDLGVLEPGRYLVALMKDKRRVSNVSVLIVDPAYTPARGARLTLSVLEPPRGEVPALGVQAIGPNPMDPLFTNSAVASTDILVDGEKRSLSSVNATGPTGPLQPEFFFAVIRDLSKLAPPLTSSPNAALGVRVGSHVSNTVTIPGAYPDAAAWDAGTLRLGVASPPPPQLTGVVTGTDGKPGAGYTVTLAAKTDEASANYVERTDKSGNFAFRSIPSGRYSLRCEYADAQIQIADVDVIENQTARIDVSLERRYHFSGHVRDSSGNPIEDAAVSASWQDADGTIYRESVRTDGYGVYTAGSPVSAPCTVRVTKTGYVESPRQDGAAPRPTVLTDRNDVDLILVTEDERGQSEKDMQEVEADDRAAQQLPGHYATDDSDSAAELTIRPAGRGFDVLYGGLVYRMQPTRGGLAYRNGATRARFEFRSEDQRYYLIEWLPGRPARETAFVRRADAP